MPVVVVGQCSSPPGVPSGKPGVPCTGCTWPTWPWLLVWGRSGQSWWFLPLTILLDSVGSGRMWTPRAWLYPEVEPVGH